MVWAPAPPVAATAPPGCPWANNNLQQCSVDGTPRPRGSIGLLGDSVLLGSANGMSSPGLPTMLAGSGWGPVNLTATLGMRTRNNSNHNVSAWHWVDRWQRSGYRPSTYVINVGANHLGDCPTADTAPCRARILELLDKIGPDALVWWPKMTYYPLGGAPGPGMLGWNRALDEVAAVTPNLIVWDWPTALAWANPAISMDLNRVHPRSGSEYVKRSRLMTDDLDRRVGLARYAGPRATLPAAATVGGLTYLPRSSNGAVVGPVSRPAASTLEFVVPPPPTSTARAVVLTVGAAPLGPRGFFTAHPCDAPRPAISNGNVSPTTWGTVQAIVRVPDDGRICVYTHTAMQISVDVQGWFVDTGGLRLSPQPPDRLLDSRITGRSTDYRLRIPGASVVALNFVATNASAIGSFRFSDCSGNTPLPQSTYPPGGIVAGAAYVPVGPDGDVCISGPTTADLAVDLTGVFRPDGGLTFTPAVPTRLLDTRPALGGWIGRHGAFQQIDVLAAPVGAAAVTGTLTMVNPARRGFLAAFECGLPVPTASAVNAQPFSASANSVTVGLGASRLLCIFARQNTHTLFDIAGWWSS